MPDILLQTVERIDIITQSTQGLPGIAGPRGLPGPPGGSTLEYTAGLDIGGHRAVILDAQGHLVYASAGELSHMGRIVGITVGAAAAGTSCQVQGIDQLEEPTWSWNSDLPVYLGANGVLTQQVPALPAAKFSMVMGFPISSTSLFVSLREPIVLSN